MSGLKIEEFRTSSSSLDDFFNPPARVASKAPGRIRISSLSALAGFSMVSSDTLIHLSQKDFWKLGQDEGGSYIERLVSDDSPVQE